MRDNRNTSWLWVDNALIDREDLNIYEKMLYVCLARHAGQKDYAFPSVETLRKELGLKDTRTIVKYVRSLESKGLIMIEKINGKSNRYYLNNVLPPTCDVPTYDVPPTSDDTTPPTCDVPTPPTSDVPLSKKINKKDDVPLDEESIELKNNIIELRNIIVKATGQAMQYVEAQIKPYNYKDIDLKEFISKIKQSDFLMGKCETKPKISNFTWENNIISIMSDNYANKEEKKQQQGIDTWMPKLKEF